MPDGTNAAQPRGDDPAANRPVADHPRDSAPALAALGWSEQWAATYAALALDGCRAARVGRVDRGRVLTLSERGPIHPEPARRLLDRGGIEHVPAVGDWVAVHVRDDGGASVEAVLPRRTAFVRKDPFKSDAQVLAANVDSAFIVLAATAEPKPGRLERELALAWESGAAPVVVLTKADLARDAERVVEAVESIALGVPVHLTSAVDGSGVEALERYLRGASGEQRTVVLLGASGTGKSTLANRLAGAELLETGEVRASDQRGRHTTTARHLFALERGGVLIDTPGLRSVGLWEADEGMALAFPDIDGLAKQCRFRDCAHRGEPGCAVAAALESGELPERRFANYRAMEREARFAAWKEDPLLQQERIRGVKRVNREIRQRRRQERRER